LEVLGSILSGPRTARLTKALVYDTQAAANVTARQRSSEDVGEFQITVTPRPGHTLTDLETAVDDILQRFIPEGPTAEDVQKATSGAELAFLRGLESNLGKANQLIDGAMFRGDAHYFRTHIKSCCQSPQRMSSELPALI
jgi:zinc protease